MAQAIGHVAPDSGLITGFDAVCSQRLTPLPAESPPGSALPPWSSPDLARRRSTRVVGQAPDRQQASHYPWPAHRTCSPRLAVKVPRPCDGRRTIPADLCQTPRAGLWRRPWNSAMVGMPVAAPPKLRAGPGRASCWPRHGGRKALAATAAFAIDSQGPPLPLESAGSGPCGNASGAACRPAAGFSRWWWL